MKIRTMAWRNVWRNSRRTLVSISAMSFALFVVLLYSGLVQGYLQGMSADLVDLGTGHVQVFHPEYRERPSIYSTIEDPDTLLSKLDEAGYDAAPELVAGGLGASGELGSGVSLLGIDVERDAQVSKIRERIDKGEWLDPAVPSGVVVGKRLAKALALDVGDELIVLSQAVDGSMANDLYEIRGVLSTVGEGVDRAGVLMNAGTFRELMSLPEGAHRIVVRLPMGTDLAGGTDVVAAAAGEDLAVLSWKELYPSMATMLESTEGMIYLLYFIFYVAVGILILNAMLMAVFERVKEFGVMKAIGLEPGKVVALILLEAAVQIGIAVAAGILVALPGMWYLSTYGIDMGGMGGMNVGGVAMSQIWYAIYSPESIQAPVVMLVVMAGLAVLYPAFKAAWIKPVTAMRHQ